MSSLGVRLGLVAHCPEDPVSTSWKEDAKVTVGANESDMLGNVSDAFMQSFKTKKLRSVLHIERNSSLNRSSSSQTYPTHEYLKKITG